MAAFVKLISAAEDEYLPSGPPMSPLTASFRDVCQFSPLYYSRTAWA